MEIIYENILGRFLLSSSVENQLAPVSFFFFFLDFPSEFFEFNFHP